MTVSEFTIGQLRPAGDMLDVDVRVTCSSGTYIRALARDLGEALGTGGHLTMLRRTRVGPYDLSMARTLDQLAAGFSVIPLAEAAAAAFPARRLTGEQARALSHGAALTLPGPGAAPAPDGQPATPAAPPGPATPAGPSGPVAAFGPDGTFIALIEEDNGRARPVAVFVP